MKRLTVVLFFAFISAVFAQFRDQSNQPDIRGGMITSETPSLVLGFINPNNFEMHHSYSMSYSTFGSNGLAIGMYTNSMIYKFSDQLNIQLDASIIHSPFSTFGKNITNQINGIYIDKAELNYKPFKDFNVHIQYSNNPYRYNNYYDPFFGSIFNRGGSMFNDDPFYGR